ncbi:ABC transporter ATP-binding protein [Bacillus sp. V3B]|uniref:ABC transporter ATP-binding protein n=1 Tax=Bacillus sp. V3B TaxID=2804915 RepID=UPI00210B3CCF|nr:ABC transporter ATP-binding protein [Bacillus sp. V3B]MCQ6275173.1 ABC transporter ATP-binding protein [Bacillus sp. V3B]
MATVLSFLKPYRIPVVVALLLMLTELVVELLQPLLMAKIIDEGILKEDLSAVLFWGGIMVGISLLAFLAGITNSFFSAHVSQSYGYDIRRKLYEKIQNFSFTNLNQFRTSSLITRLTNDVTQLQNTIFMGLRIMMRAPLLVMGAIIMAFVVNAKVALILIVTVPILFLFLIFILQSGRKQFTSVQVKLDSVNNVMRENLTAMRLIKAFLRHTYESKRFQKVSSQLMDKTSHALRLMETTMPVLLFVMNLSILGLLWFGRAEINQGGIKVGEVVAIINYALRITASLSVFSFIIMVFSRFRASTDRVSEILTERNDQKDGYDLLEINDPLKGKVEFQHVAFRYPSTDVSVVKDISFFINPGQTVAVLGATGSGKTSLFQLIPRLYDVDEGEILIDNRNVKEYQLEQLRQQISYVSQESLLFTGTIRENIAWGKKDASLEEIMTAAKHAQIHETISKLPGQYETKLGQKGVNLSGGQKQRLSIARALVRQPKILLLDDSTSALDLQTEAKLLQVLKSYTCTTMIITQKISTVLEADLVLLIEDGSLLAKGNHESLLATSPLYRRIYQSQMDEGRVGNVQGVK